MLSVAHLHVYLRLHLQKCGQFICGLHKGCRDIYAADPAAKALRHVASRATNAATYIEDMVMSLDRQGVGEFHGGRQSTGVEMIDGCHLFYGHVLKRDGRRSQRLQYSG